MSYATRDLTMAADAAAAWAAGRPMSESVRITALPGIVIVTGDESVSADTLVATITSESDGTLMVTAHIALAGPMDGETIAECWREPRHTRMVDAGIAAAMWASEC